MTVPEMPTWIACLTPPGQSALATVGLYGPRAWVALRKLFRLRNGNELTEEPEGRHFWFGRIGGEMADEVVVAIKQSDPVPWLEVNGHGGREVVHYLIDLFREQGLQLCGWQEFLRKTSPDALSAVAAIELAQATTLRTGAILLDQQHGALSRAMETIQQSLARGETAAAKEGLQQLERYAAVGQYLTRPWRVVVAGAPNVGKSSLVNALAGYRRSIVAATPGTTRDVVTTRLAVDGWLIELADTAGQRNAAESLEEQGIHQARATAAAADLCLWVLDRSTAPVWPNEPLAWVQYVINKSDLPAAWDTTTIRETVQVCALTGEGLAELCSAVIERLVPMVPPSGAAVPFTPRIWNGIAQARMQLDAGRTAEASRILADLRETPARSVSEGGPR